MNGTAANAATLSPDWLPSRMSPVRIRSPAPVSPESHARSRRALGAGHGRKCLELSGRFGLRPGASSARLDSDPSGAAVLGKGGLRVDGWVPADRESEEPVHADRRIGGEQVCSGLAGVPHQLVLRVDGEAQSRRVPPFLLASGTDIDDPLGAAGSALAG